jgi:hypothetical protein
MSARAIDIVTLPAPEEAENIEFEPVPLSPYRDVRDVRLLCALSITALMLSSLLIISLGIIFYLATRPAQQIVIERSSEGDRVIAVNGQAVKNGISVGVDKPGANDKKTLAREWAAARYGVDPLTREKDIEKMFKMMAPNAARAYAAVMKRNGELERESAERWQAVWKPQVVEVDRADQYRVNIVGTMEITKKASNGEQREAKQIMFGLHLIPDAGRAPRNMQTGFLVDDILDLKEIPIENGPASALTAQ